MLLSTFTIHVPTVIITAIIIVAFGAIVVNGICRHRRGERGCGCSCCQCPNSVLCHMHNQGEELKKPQNWTKSRLLEAVFCPYERSFEKKERIPKKGLTFYNGLWYYRRQRAGEVSEWFKELVLKTSDPARDQEFESLPLRQYVNKSHYYICHFRFTMFTILEKYPSGEGAPLLREQVGKPAQGFKSLLLRQGRKTYQ